VAWKAIVDLESYWAYDCVTDWVVFVYYLHIQ